MHLVDNVYQLAQLNIARMRAELDSALMKGFTSRLNEINGIAESSPGFVWRLKDESGNATAIRWFGDPTILVNLSVWESLEHLKVFIFKTDHAELMRNRKKWFHSYGYPSYALWWIPFGSIPTPYESKKRLLHLQEKGPSDYAFDFKHPFPVPDQI